MLKTDPELLEATPLGFVFGTREWADAVFNDVPSRKVSGRSKGTHRGAPKFFGVAVDCEGHETTGAYILEYLQLVGVVRRWKAQPFSWRPVVGLGRKKPDFLVELENDRQLALVQVRAETYRTPDFEEVLAIEREIVENVGMLHILWTSHHPLNRSTKTLFYRIRSARTTRYEEGALSEVIQFVRGRRLTTMFDIASAGLEPALVTIAIRLGELFVDLREEYDERSVVATEPIIDGRSFFLQSGFDAESWWHGLSP